MTKIYLLYGVIIFESLVLNNIINEAFKLISYYGNSSGDLSEAAENDFVEKEKQYEENAVAAQKEYNRLIVFLNENMK